MPDQMKKDAGATKNARNLVAQLQQQAKDGQIDGAVLDQLEAVLDVGVDEATDEQTSMKSDADSVTSVSSAPSGPDASDGSMSAPAPTTPSDSSSSSSSESEESSMDTVNKSDEPLSSRPPTAPNLQFDHLEDFKRRLPEFVQAMEAGQLGKAQKIAGGDTRSFDTMFNLAQHSLLTEGGWTSGNLGKLQNLASDAHLAKSLTASSVPGIYLIRLAKLMLPVYAGLTNRIPVDSPKDGSNQAIWKAQLGFGGDSYDEAAFFRVAEASIGVEPTTDFLTFTAPYIDLAVNDSVTLKALRASAGYSDPLQIGVIKAMSLLLRGQERIVLGGNKAAISAPGTITVAQGTPAQTVIAAGSYVVGVSALTYEGWVNGSKGALSNGATTVGETAATFCTQFVLGAGSSMVASWDAVPGAVAYNVYLSGSSGHYSGSTSKFHSQVYTNSVTISTLSSGSTPQLTDTTVNATYGMEGLIAWAEKTTVLSQSIPDKVEIYDAGGGGYTAGNGGIEEFDSLLADIWTKWHTAPSLMVMSPLMNASLVGALQSLGSGGFYRIEVGNERNTVNGGMMVTGYVNKFAPFADGTPRMIDVIPHPYMPDGTVLFLSETIPYPMGNETRGFVRDVLLPYTYFPLPSQASGTNKIRYDFAITTSQTLECFLPSPQAALVCLDKDA